MDTLIHIKNLELKSGYIISDIQISSSQSLAVVGRSGSGKTEFCLKLLEQKQFFKNALVSEKIWEHVGYVTSDPNLLFSGMKSTLKGEIELSLQFLGREVSSVDDIADSFGVANLLHRDVFTLSGGEAIKAALAIVGVKNPKVWILDQIFDWLHPEMREILRRTIQQNTDTDVVIIETHCSTPMWIDEFDMCIFLDSNHKVKKGKFRDILVSLDDKFLLGADYEYHKWNEKDNDSKPYYKGSTSDEICASNSQPPNEELGLRIEGLTFKYPDNNFSIGSIDLVANPGNVFALVGSNGAGKTTLLKCLALLLVPKSGNVIVNNRQAYKKPHKRPREILYCFQNPDDQLFLPTVEDEVLMTLKQLCDGKKSIDTELLQRFDLVDKRDIDPFILPRSYKRMVTIVSSFLVCPPILLFDEPTAGLDGFQKSQLAKELKNYAAQGGICIFISHDYDFVHHTATTSLHLESGKIVSIQSNHLT